jgi:hypothetical protein
MSTTHSTAGGRTDETDLVTALTNAAATIGAIYEWVDRVEKAGGTTSIAGVAVCHAMLTSLRKNAGRTEKLIMQPARAALAKTGAA